MKSPTNIPVSVRQRLLNHSIREKRPFLEVLQYYAMERFLYRLTQSSYADHFILKGALMLRVWEAPEFRPTMDIDMLGRTSNDEENLQAIFREIITQKYPDDGLIFFDDSITTQIIKEESKYQGVRILFSGKLDTARIQIQIDVSFDDVIYPDAELLTFPSILNFPKTEIRCYNKETVIAEKFETIVRHGYQNSRMKDFYDIWLLSQLFDFEGKLISETIRRHSSIVILLTEVKFLHLKMIFPGLGKSSGQLL